MRYFDGKIFKLDAEEKNMLSMLFSEGLSCYRLVDERNPLLQNLVKINPSPFGSSQMTKNLLEIFLIRLCRHTDVLTKKMRQSYVIDGVDVPCQVKEILDFLHQNMYNRITVQDVVRHTGRSASAIKALFAMYQSDGIMHYYNSLKIKEARKLIREGIYNISQISDMLHFDNPQYFSKCFKRYTNMTPSEFKRSILR